jgi:hypothetical protein
LFLALLLGMAVMSHRNGQREAVSPEPTASAEPTAQAHAPDGRTGDAALDAIIEALLTEDEAGLRARFGSIDVYESDEPTEIWTSRLARSERSLYAVRPRTLFAAALAPLDYEIILATPGEFEPEAWLFGVIDDEVVRGYPASGQTARGELFDFEDNYDTCLVLPPVEDLPQPPDGHPLTVRTGDPGVDGLLALVQTDDVDSLLTAVEYRHEPCAGPLLNLDACQNPSVDSADVLPATRAEPGETSGPELCWGDMSFQDAAYVRRWFKGWGQPVAIHAVATIARDYEETEGQPIGGDHEIMVVLQLDRYTWQVGSLYERDGRIVGIRCRPTPTYPDPREIPYIVPPPSEGSLPPLSRRSGVGVVDAVLDALQASNAAALADLIDYDMVACVSQSLGPGSPPVCRPDELPGTPVPAFITAACEGGYTRLDDYLGADSTRTPAILQDSDWRLYALLETSRSPSVMVAVLVSSVREADISGQTLQRSTAIGLSAQGVKMIATGCQQSPESRIDSAASPSFLLPPP